MVGDCAAHGFFSLECRACSSGSVRSSIVKSCRSCRSLILSPLRTPYVYCPTSQVYLTLVQRTDSLGWNAVMKFTTQHDLY